MKEEAEKSNVQVLEHERGQSNAKKNREQVKINTRIPSLQKARQFSGSGDLLSQESPCSKRLISTSGIDLSIQKAKMLPAHFFGSSDGALTLSPPQSVTSPITPLFNSLPFTECVGRVGGSSPLSHPLCLSFSQEVAYIRAQAPEATPPVQTAPSQQGKPVGAKITQKSQAKVSCPSEYHDFPCQVERKVPAWGLLSGRVSFKGQSPSPSPDFKQNKKQVNSGPAFVLKQFKSEGKIKAESNKVVKSMPTIENQIIHHSEGFEPVQNSFKKRNPGLLDLEENENLIASMSPPNQSPNQTSIDKFDLNLMEIEEDPCPESPDKERKWSEKTNGGEKNPFVTPLSEKKGAKQIPPKKNNFSISLARVEKDPVFISKVNKFAHLSSCTEGNTEFSEFSEMRNGAMSPELKYSPINARKRPERLIFAQKEPNEPLMAKLKSNPGKVGFQRMFSDENRPSSNSSVKRVIGGSIVQLDSQEGEIKSVPKSSKNSKFSKYLTISTSPQAGPKKGSVLETVPENKTLENVKGSKSSLMISAPIIMFCFMAIVLLIEGFRNFSTTREA